MNDVKLYFPSPRGGRELVVEHADFYVEDGELLVILGPSGCGKSTLLKMLAGLLKPSAGSVSFRPAPEGEMAELSGPTDKIGIVFQNYSLFPWLTARGNIEFGPRAQRLRPGEYWPRIEELLNISQLKSLEDKYPGQLSGGEQQRVAIVRSLVNRPKVLLMDEPFGALDVQTRWQMQDFLIRTKQRTGATIVFVTHDIDEAVYVGDRIVVASPRPLKLCRQFVVPFSADVRAQQLRVDSTFSSLVNQVRDSVLEAARIDRPPQE
jgi:ABC-type nitrate/sulfonate/bicarbonate transport system ATPase subunit